MQPLPVKANVKNIEYQSEISYPPYKYLNNDHLTGFEVELTSLIFKNEDYKLSISTDSWDTIYERLKSGDIDTCGLLVINDEREKEVLFSNPVMDTHIAIYTRSGFNKVSLKDLRKYSVGVGKSQYSKYILKNRLNLSNYKEYINVEQAVDALARGEIDVLFEDQEVVKYYIIDKGLKGTLVPQATDLFPQKVAYGVKRSDPELVEYINKRLKQLQKSGVYEEFYQKYFFSHSHFYKHQKREKYFLIIEVIIAALLMLHIISHFYIKRLKKKIYDEVSYSNEVLDNCNLFSMAVNSEGLIVKLNKYGEYILGLSLIDTEEKNIHQLSKENEVLNKLDKIITDFLDTSIPSSNINLNIKVEESELAFLFSVTALYNEKDKIEYIVLLGIDITERIYCGNKVQQQYMELEATYGELAAIEEELRAQYDELLTNQQLLEESENRYRTILESTSDGIWELDTNTNNFFISKRFADMLELDEQAFNNSKAPLERLYTLFHPEDKDFVRNKFKEQDTLGLDAIQYECRIKTKADVYKWFIVKSKALKDKNGKVYKKIGAITDIDDLKMYQQQLHYSAYYDTLTNLPNRLYLYESIAPLISKTIKTHHIGAFIFIDVDNFKLINDTFGHITGDILLQKIAERLSHTCPKKSNIIRLGGDEFIIVLSNDASRYSVELFAKKLIDAFAEPFNIGEIVVNSTLSVGICMFPEDGEDLGALLKNADTAMYRAKNSGRNNFAFYNKSMSENLIDRIKLESNLKMALDDNEFKLYYQPQLDLKTGKISGLEALIRWDNPQLGRIPPDKFIRTAEEMGLIIPIGEWVLKTACEFLVKLHNLGFKTLNMSVNISIVQLIQNNFPDIVLTVLKESGLHPKFLELEITETVLMETIEANIEKLEKLKSIGVRVALDDFGKGYSSLNYLKSLPISTLKIDKSFMNDVLIDNCTESVVSSIILIGRKMGLNIVAEGIEEEDQLEYLKASECNLLQGYLLSRPLPEEETIDFLASHIKIS